MYRIGWYRQGQSSVPRSVSLQGDEPDFALPIGLLISTPFGPGQMVYDVENWYLVSDGAPKYESYISHDFIFGVTVLDGYMEPLRCCFFREDDKFPDGFSPYMSV